MITETLEYLVIAFISSAVLIVMSKIILQHLIRRPADYYLADELRQEELMLNSAGFSITEEIETNPEGEITEEYIDVTPQISVEEALDMHLIDKERIPERFLKHKDEESESAEPYPDPLDEMNVLSSIILAPDNDEAENTKTRDKSKSDKLKRDKSKTKNDPADKKGRRPSMKMRKDELLALAAEKGIELPEKATKKDILELLNADKPQKKQNKQQQEKPKKQSKQQKSSSGGRRQSQDKQKKQNRKKSSKKTEESSNQE